MLCRFASSKAAPEMSFSVRTTAIEFEIAFAIGESLFTLFASLAYVPLFLLELQNRLF